MKLHSLVITLGAALFGSSCQQATVDRNCDFDAAIPCPNLTDPYGRIEGTIIYQGPEPLLRADGVPSGRIVLLLFAANNPPPPAGTATTALSVHVVTAADLFRSATRLPDNSIRATLAYSFPFVRDGGEYQIRAFYSRNDALAANVGGVDLTVPAGFEPLFGVRRLPVRGDVGGGAIVDPTAAIPQFVRIPVGERTTDDRGTHYTIPLRGWLTPNVTVFVGSQFPLDRPMFRSDEATGMNALVRMTAQTAPAPPGLREDAPYEVPPPSDGLLAHARDTGLLPAGAPMLDMYRNPVINDSEGGTDIPSFALQFSLPPSECEIAALAGVACAVRDPIQQGFVEFAFDRNENGAIDLTLAGRFADTHPTLVTTNPLAAMTNGRVPWLYPLVILSKLHEPTPEEAAILRGGVDGGIPRAIFERIRASLNAPEHIDPVNNRYPVLLFGSIVPGRAASNFLVRPWSAGYRQFEDSLRIALVPLAVEIHGPDQARDWWAIVPPGTAAVATAAAPFLPATYRCDLPLAAVPLDEDSQQPTGVPAGRYAINLLGPGGQSWTTPNELAGFIRGIPEIGQNTTAQQRMDIEAQRLATSTVCDSVTGPGTQHLPFCRAVSQGLVVRMRGLENATGLCPDPTMGPVPRSTCRAAEGVEPTWCNDPNLEHWPRRLPAGR